MPARVLHCLITAAFLSPLILGAQMPVRRVSDVRAAAASAEKARALVDEQALAVQSIDRFTVSHQVDITSVTTHYNRTTHAFVKTWVERPGHLRAESQQYTRSETIVSDGSTMGLRWRQPDLLETVRRRPYGAILERLSWTGASAQQRKPALSHHRSHAERSGIAHHRWPRISM
jgi:hypothetical protein